MNITTPRRHFARGAAATAVAVLLALTVATPASAASAGPNAATTAVSTTWTGASNATGTANGLCATAGPAASIDVAGFGFGLPQGATITGVTVEAKIARSTTSGGNTQAVASLLKGGVAAGATKTLAGGAQTTCSATAFQTLGSASDMWGTALTAADINAPNFGVRITTGTAAITWRLDAVRVTIHLNPDVTAPVLSLDAVASLTNDNTPALTGIAGTAPGDDAQVSLTIHQGADLSGPVVEALSAARDALTGAFTADAAPLADGTYTVVATQGDDSGNATSSTAHTFTVDATAPGALASVASGQSDPTNVAAIAFDVVFTEPVSGFDASDVVTGGSAAISGVTVDGSGAEYDVVATAAADGSVSIAVPAGAAVDAAGNQSTAANASASVTYDATAPSVASITRTGAERTNGSSVDFAVTFSEPVTGVDVEQFALTATGTLTGASVSGVSGSGDSYVVSVATGAGDGSLRLDVVDGSAVADAAGNALAAGFTQGESYILDRTAPATAIDELIAHDDLEVTVVVSPATVTGTAGECGATTVVTFVDLLGGGSVDVDAAAGACEGGVQSWSAAAPAQGLFDVTAVSTDDVGNTGPVSETVKGLAL